METNSSSTPMSGPTMAKFLNDPDYDPTAESIQAKQYDYFSRMASGLEPGMVETIMIGELYQHYTGIDATLSEGIDAGRFDSEEVDELKEELPIMHKWLAAMIENYYEKFADATKDNGACQAIARDASRGAAA